MRHIERTRLLVHVIDVSGSEGRDPVDDYFKIKGELTRYSPRLGELKQVVAANKMDVTGAQDNLDRLREALKSEDVEVFPVSAAMAKGFDALIDCLVKTLDTLPKTYEFEEEGITETHRYEPGFNIERTAMCSSLPAAAWITYSIPPMPTMKAPCAASSSSLSGRALSMRSARPEPPRKASSAWVNGNSISSSKFLFKLFIKEKHR